MGNNRLVGYRGTRDMGARFGFDASFSVPFVEWGLVDPSNFLLKVGKEVPVTIHAKGVTVQPVSSP